MLMYSLRLATQLAIIALIIVNETGVHTMIPVLAFSRLLPWNFIVLSKTLDDVVCLSGCGPPR